MMREKNNAIQQRSPNIPPCFLFDRYRLQKQAPQLVNIDINYGEWYYEHSTVT